MGGTAWFWNGASARWRRAVSVVFLAASCIWLAVDLLRPPVSWSVAVPVFLIALFGVQWRAAARSLREEAGDEGAPDSPSEQ